MVQLNVLVRYFLQDMADKILFVCGTICERKKLLRQIVKMDVNSPAVVREAVQIGAGAGGLDLISQLNDISSIVHGRQTGNCVFGNFYRKMDGACFLRKELDYQLYFFSWIPRSSRSGTEMAEGNLSARMRMGSLLLLQVVEAIIIHWMSRREVSPMRL